MDTNCDFQLDNRPVTFQDFIDQEGECDVVVKARKGVWNLHKRHLVKAKYFQLMFGGCWKETDMECIQIDIPDPTITEEALNLAFHSLYTHDIHIDPCKGVSLLATASFLMYDELIQLCESVITQHIDLSSVTRLFEAGQLYGATVLSDVCVFYLQRNLMGNLTPRLLKEINSELMSRIVAGADLLVLKAEKDIYHMLRKWLYLQLNPKCHSGWIHLELLTNAFIKSSTWKPSFLEIPQGAPFINVFSKLRIEHILTDHSSAKILESDSIVPYLWVLNCYRSQWLQLLRVDNGQDSGPKEFDSATFLEKSMRFGIVLDNEDEFSWNWAGCYSGTNFVMKYVDDNIYIKRNTCQCLDDLHSDKLFTYQLTVSVVSSAVSTVSSAKQNLFSGMKVTGIKRLSLQKDEEVALLYVDREFGFPLYVSLNILLYTPHSDSDCLQESIAIGTVCSYYTTGRMYGAKDVPEKCIKYLQGSLMPNMTVQLLKDIEPELMTHLIDGVDLFVLQVEMDVYTMLRKWLYLRLHPNYEGTLKELIQDTDAFIKSEVASSWRPSFLESPEGAPFINVFSKLRIEHILTDHSSAKILESDGIVPYLWVLNCYRSQWLQLLRVDNGQDSGPKEFDVETFEKKAMRCGRKLDTEGQYCWRWTGFNYGIDILVTCMDHRILLKRNIPSGNCHCVVAPQPRKHIVYRLTVTTAADDQPSSSQTTGIKHLSLRKDEEVCVLTVDRKITFPLFISCNFLLYTPELTTPKDPPVADVAAVVNSPQPLPGPSVQEGSSTD